MTPTLLARSSASWRRFVRDVAACVRSACAMLVPKRSVCVSIATSARTSSSWTRRARFAKRFESRLAGPDLAGQRPKLLRELGQCDLQLLAGAHDGLIEARSRLDAHHNQIKSVRQPILNGLLIARVSRAPASGLEPDGPPRLRRARRARRRGPSTISGTSPEDQAKPGRGRAVVARGVGIAPPGRFKPLLQPGHFCGLSLGPFGELICGRLRRQRCPTQSAQRVRAAPPSLWTATSRRRSGALRAPAASDAADQVARATATNVRTSGSARSAAIVCA